MVAPRLQRWILFLSAYDYALRYRPGAANCNADALSRLPLQETGEETGLPEEVVLTMSVLAAILVKAQQIAQWTGKDPALSRVRNFTWHGWPNIVDDDQLQPYFRRKL